MVQQLLVGDVCKTAAARRPNDLAVALDDEALTFAELHERSLDLARRLLGSGIAHGDRVAWWAETSLEAAIVYCAVAHIGAVFLPLNPRYSREEGQRILVHAEPTIVLGKDRAGCIELADLPPAPADVTLPAVSEHDPFVIFYTSGTTGEPKGCVLTHRSERLRAGIGSPWPVGARICMFPQYHMAGWSFALTTWLGGDTFVFVRRADAPDVLAAIERHRASKIYCLPAVWRRILDHDRSGYDLSSLRCADTGTSATSPELLRELTDAFPDASVSVAYGSTEAGMVCQLGPDDLFTKPGSVGLAAPGAEIRLDGQGQMQVRCPSLFAGYFRNPQATEQALSDGWFATGDLAERDADGYYRIVGRAREIIRTGGETVAPVEVDLVLQSHPDIADAAIAGMTDDVWGEVIVAFVVPRTDCSITLEAIRAHCQGQLAPYKLPRRLVLLDAIPRTRTTGQVERKTLAALAADQQVLS